MPMNILIAPSGFKESLSATEVADRIEAGVRRILRDAVISKVPMVDGGEGFVAALTAATGGEMLCRTVTGPVGLPVASHFGFLGGQGPRTAVVEMAAAAGLSLVPRDRRDPELTTSYGVGELVHAALDAGAESILLGCGDSGVNDGGAGMAEALGAVFLDRDGNRLPRGGGALARLASIDISGLDPRLARVRIDAAVNWHNVLTGPRGVARVFAPQKGASPAQVELLSQAMDTYAAVVAATTGIDVATPPGAGASGGLGAAVMGLLGGRLHPRYDIAMRYLDLDGMIAKADLVITAEGSLDAQTPYGKIPAEVARRAKRYGLPVIALAGTIGKGVIANFDHGIDAFASILKRPCSLDDAIANAGKLLERAAEDAARMVRVGMILRTPGPRRREGAPASCYAKTLAPASARPAKARNAPKSSRPMP